MCQLALHMHQSQDILAQRRTKVVPQVNDNNTVLVAGLSFDDDDELLCITFIDAPCANATGTSSKASQVSKLWYLNWHIHIFRILSSNILNS